MSFIKNISALLLVSGIAFGQSVSSPTPNSQLSGETVTFTFDDGGQTVEEYYFSLGTADNNWNLTDGSVSAATASVTVNNIPTNTKTIYGEFQWKISGVWSSQDVTWTAANPVPIIASRTLNVPADFDTIQDALAFLEFRPIAANATVTIQVANGNYTNYDSIEFTHPDGDRIQILGNETDATLCKITFKNDVNGISLEKGKHLGKLNGFHLAGGNRTQHGVNVTFNSTLECGDEMKITNFGKGVYASKGARVEIAEAVITDNGTGIYAIFQATVRASGATLTNNDANGAMVVILSYAWLENTTISGNGAEGVVSVGKTYVGLDGATISNNTLSGVLVNNGGNVVGWNAVITNNGQYGALLYNDAYGNLSSVTLSGNTSGNTNIPLNTAQYDLAFIKN